MNEKDFIGAGFKKVDQKVLEAKAPKINWGVLYKKKTDAEKIAYLEKFAASMNHAASLIQDERNQLNRLCELKERQIVSLKKAMDANNAMLQQEITRMNQQRQGFNKEVARLNREIGELKNADQR